MELVELLILYKRYKEIAGWMMERQENNLRTYLRVAPPPKVEAKLDLSNLTLEGLLAAAADHAAQRRDIPGGGNARRRTRILGMPSGAIRAASP